MNLGWRAGEKRKGDGRIPMRRVRREREERGKSPGSLSLYPSSPLRRGEVDALACVRSRDSELDAIGLLVWQGVVETIPARGSSVIGAMAEALDTRPRVPR